MSLTMVAKEHWGGGDFIESKVTENMVINMIHRKCDWLFTGDHDMDLIDFKPIETFGLFPIRAKFTNGNDTSEFEMSFNLWVIADKPSIEWPVRTSSHTEESVVNYLNELNERVKRLEAKQ